MGQRTVFYKSAFGHSLKTSILHDYINCRAWLLSTAREGLLEEVSDEFLDFIKGNEVLPKLELMEQKVLDELTYEYLLSYCDYGEGQGSFDSVGPMMSTYRYNEASTYILKSTNEELKSLWSVLPYGRSLDGNRKFLLPNDNRKIGFWTNQEQKVLLSHLKVLSKYRPGLEGVELILSLLKEIADDKIEIIIDIEE